MSNGISGAAGCPGGGVMLERMQEPQVGSLALLGAKTTELVGGHKAVGRTRAGHSLDRGVPHRGHGPAQDHSRLQTTRCSGSLGSLPLHPRLVLLAGSVPRWLSA